MSTGGCAWVTDVRETMLREKIGDGLGASEPLTVMQLFEKTVADHPSAPALCYKPNGNGEGSEWKQIVFSEYLALVRQVARGLISLGVERFDAVSILASNSYQWFVANYAAIYAGAIATGIYITNGSDAASFIARHSESSVVIVDSEAQLSKFANHELPKVRAFVCWQPGFSSRKMPSGVTVYSWEDLLAIGSDQVQEDGQYRHQALARQLEERVASQTPGHCCTLIYTSGTTGTAKGVMISHDNVTFTARALVETIGLKPEDRVVSYLPLSHIAAQILDMHGSMASGCSIWFARPDALRGTLVVTLNEVHPTVFLGVPRVWERFHETFRNIPGISGAIVRSKLGLDKCRLEFTSAAPIARETLLWFASINISLLEIFGMSELTGPATFSLLTGNQYKLGTCGVPMCGTEIKIAEPVDADGIGEIVFRGRHVFMGYFKNPEDTSAMIDADGYAHSGDLGAFEDSKLVIRGRLKELIITAGGENVAPVFVEHLIKEALPQLVANCMVIGDRRKFISAVMTLRTVPDAATGQPTKTLIPQIVSILEAAGSCSKTSTEAATDPVVLRLVQQGVDSANLKAVSQAQQIKKFAILENDFSIGGGELTPTMKLKRKVVAERYAALIDSMYLTVE
eukprot:ANDGO_05864.mRNA.1 Very long-chain-fatty-acid--CoA ligase bubblegum